MLSNVFMTTTSRERPLDGLADPVTEASGLAADRTATVSDFLTVQSFANFAVTTGAISMAWQALRQLDADTFDSRLVPFAFCAVFAALSFATSRLRGQDAGWTTVISGLFVTVVNGLVLFSAVLGAQLAVAG
ncbi:MAG: hypothetical protein L0Y54_06045 [Sporichthyaceae bacterium]|nr:hypothetical protein [Sporichthyaceae bacterium]